MYVEQIYEHVHMYIWTRYTYIWTIYAYVHGQYIYMYMKYICNMLYDFVPGVCCVAR